MTAKEVLFVNVIPAIIGVIVGTTISYFTRKKEKSKSKKQFIKKNFEEVETYNKALNAVADLYKKKNLTDFQLLMTVIQDAHRIIKGIGEPRANELTGYWGINVMMRDFCVCRNLACYLADLLNKINPKYNAEMLCVAMHGTSSETVFAVRSAVYVNEEQEENEKKEQKKKSKFSKIIESMRKNQASNHAITTVKINGDYLYVDPLNCGMIGAYRRGKIRFFNSGESDTLFCKTKEFTTKFYRKNSITQYSELDWIRLWFEKQISFVSDKNWTRLYHKYNVEEQMKANLSV